MADDFGSHAEGLDAPADNAAEVTPGATALDKTTRALFIGGAGDVDVTMAGGGDVTFAATAGSILPIRVTHVLGTSTATSIVALW